MSLLRPATTADLSTVRDLLGAEWPHERGAAAEGKWKERLQDLEDNRDGHPEFAVWLLEDGGTVVAVAVTQLLSRRRQRRVGGVAYPVYLEYLVTRCSHRSRGYGAQMEKHVIGTLAARGYGRVFLLVEPGRTDALRFWTSRGLAAGPGGRAAAHPGADGQGDSSGRGARERRRPGQGLRTCPWLGARQRCPFSTG
ncbi:GNAT family N-acetyltransferase [Streptomyces sp. 5K101]|uniref:GNAT family N-acetyltransferase n=1 Tax=Streptomyces sp. 5K101 TaxID=3390037 RepID=UPI0039761B10